MSITKNMSRARNASSTYSRSKPSRFDWLLWNAINKNTTKRNNLANVTQTGSNVDLSAISSTTTVKGLLSVDGHATFKDSLTTAEGVEYGLTASSGHKHGFLRSVPSLLSSSAGANTDITLGTLPADCRIVNLILSTDAIITTAGNLGDDVDFSLGIAATTGQIIDQRAICLDGGAAVSIDPNVLYYLIKDGRPTAANAIDATGILEDGTTTNNPVTSEAITMSLTAHVLPVDRIIVARLTPLSTNLVGTTGNVTVILEFMTA